MDKVTENPIENQTERISLDRMKELIRILSDASRTYYMEDREIMSNFEYDRLYDELSMLEQKTGIVLSNSPTQKVGYEVVSSLPKEQHPSPMLSLDKTKEVDQLVSWLGDHEGVLSWKLDGLTVVLTYENGVLIKAVTRGNGETGEVITPNARVFLNVPKSIPIQERFTVRGEAIIFYSDFDRINNSIEDIGAKYKNPRNLCSGSVRQLNSQITAQRSVRFYAFSMVDPEDEELLTRAGMTMQKRYEFLRSIGFDTVEYRMVDKEDLTDTIVAKARGIIMRNVYPLLRLNFEETTGQPFAAGIKVLLQVSISFSELYGYSLVIQDIDPNYTLGSIAQQRKEIWNRLQREGVAEMNQMLELPVLMQRIAIVSSPTAAGYEDFCSQLDKNAHGFFFQYKLFPAMMQGEEVESTIIRLCRNYIRRYCRAYRL